MQTIDLAALTERTLTNFNRALATTTLWPWVVEATFQTPQDTIDRRIVIVKAALADRPDAEKHIPAGCELVRSVVFPASQLTDMTDETRQRYRPHYRAFLMWNAAQVAEKEVVDLVPWTDYQPIDMDNAVTAWSRVIPLRSHA